MNVEHRGGAPGVEGWGEPAANRRGTQLGEEREKNKGLLFVSMNAGPFVFHAARETAGEGYRPMR